MSAYVVRCGRFSTALAESPVDADDRALLFTIGDMKPTVYSTRKAAEAAIKRTIDGPIGKMFGWTSERFSVQTVAEYDRERDSFLPRSKRKKKAGAS